MDLSALERQVRTVLDQARDSLARIEQHVRESGDEATFLPLSRVYAQYCMHARDLLGGFSTGRPMPRRFAQKVRELQSLLGPYRRPIAELDLHPTPDEFETLVKLSESVPGVA